MKIVILDGATANPGDLSWQEFEQLGDVTIYDRTDPRDILPRAGDAEIVLTNKTPLRADTLRQMPNLKYIGVLATGVNVVDVETAKEMGIIVTNVPAYSTDSVAQQVFALLLGITNRPETYARLNRKGRWSTAADFCYTVSPLIELAGKQLGIIGLGSIGMKVAEIARAFGMKVTAMTSKPQEALPEWITRQEFEELLSTSDVVTLHCPLTDANRHLINAHALSLMKPTAILINTARGALVDEEALADALEQHVITAAGLDVLTREPPHTRTRLLHLRNCLTTPHIAWATREARDRLIHIAAANLRNYLNK